MARARASCSERYRFPARMSSCTRGELSNCAAGVVRGVPGGPIGPAVPAQKTVAASGPRAPVQRGAAPAWHDASPDAALASSQIPQSAAREFALRLRRGATSVWVEVFDPDLRLPRIRTAGETDEGGRGLYLVEQLATRWGSRPTPEGKAVWFEMPRRGSLL